MFRLGVFKGLTLTLLDGTFYIFIPIVISQITCYGRSLRFFTEKGNKGKGNNEETDQLDNI